MRRILIVEDNPDLAFGLRNNLEIEGYDIAVAEDGLAGLREARASAPDLIILDLMMPGLDGYRVLRTLRDEGNSTPVLILSAKGEEAGGLWSRRAFTFARGNCAFAEPKARRSATSRTTLADFRAFSFGTRSDMFRAPGEVSEWLKVPDSKSGVGKPTEGSNPSLSATFFAPHSVAANFTLSARIERSLSPSPATRTTSDSTT